MVYIYIVLLVAVDQLTKYFAAIKLTDKVITLIPGLLELAYLENRGAAFGIFQSKRVILVGVTSIIIVFLIAYMIKNRNMKKIIRCSLVLIIGGAIGNLIDRVLRSYVVDYIHFYIGNVFDWPVFNFADICVVVGTILLAIEVLFDKEQDSKVVK